MTLEWVEKWAQWELMKEWLAWVILGVIALVVIIVLIANVVMGKIEENERQKRKDKDNV